MRPTIIVKPPVKRAPILADGQGRGRYGRAVLFITCDNGVEYELSVLAAIIGMTASGLYQRLRSYSWQHPLILSRKCEPHENLSKQTYLRHTADSGTDEWRRLSGRPRTALLDRLPSPCIFERTMGDR